MSRGGLLRSTAVFSAMTFLSRIAGLARDQIQANLFGTGAAVSAFVVAYRIPNYLRRIFAEGSFSSAFVPVLSELHQRGDQAALKDFLDHVAGALLAVVLAITGLGMLFAPVIARLFLLFAGKDSEQVALTADMLRITFPYLAFISMTAMAGAVLNSLRRFGLPAFTPVLHNLGMIAAMLGLAAYFEIREYALAWGVFLAGLLQLLLLWPALGRLGVAPRLRLDFRHAGVRRVFGLMLPTIFSSSVSQLNLLVGTMFASLLIVNAQAWLYYSDRLVEFPLGLFGVAIGTVILPHLSRRFADTDAQGYSQAIDWGLRLVALVSVPAALGLALMSGPLCATLFQYGAFTEHDTRMVSASVMAMSVGVPAFMLSKVLLPAFYARQDTRTPMRAAVLTVFVNVLLTVLLVTPLWYWGFGAAHGGIALATALAGIVNAGLLWRYLIRQGVYRAQRGWARLFLQIALASALMSAVVLYACRQVGDWADLGPWYLRAAWLAAVVGAGALAYGLGLLLAGVRPRQLREA
ncbi:MAG TPA: murein biosynthesis integral membrane protein MurJ [Arenimonas sp.]|uniref:murein biosynthesis integral membrane protein MurJ n=1 Tax=Arenimonas sp. TaxID=1872635 RepID=UPI002D7E5EDA|nr:murein biosynthesis integral membrane protein MurJ [Arenimonas sp.]HEU0153316.1 murein biosynthesis integral membrane protein MurJ [Arenimonas sp.]